MKYKKKYGINKMTLSDNSFKYCSGCPISLNLSSLLFVLKGDTWYGSYGFKPFDSFEGKPDKWLLEKYKKNKRLFKTLTICELKLKKIKEKNRKLLRMSKKAFDSYNSFFDEKKRVRDLFRFMNTNYKEYCCLMAHILKNKIFKSKGLGHRFVGIYFYLNL